ncbi:ankyrin repeat domain-containing protein [Lusitaniella coriacea LEGE 07157]|uniref:Ankyrin repeat domain-containing protein n=1 Tax=Lusitaniella coriacea LEGE 07157 TaxID=945747 RepID=A0A8J7B7G9_9CYAN|nr:ankyrin repeat domain-containing protein [Lusitaniella coriacea]MBE9115246.1 ankyrin repeat domain-containing protein [Lusitaniella coriacea LEGE 07157]
MNKSNIMEELFDAIEDRDPKKICDLINLGCDINGNCGSAFEDGITFLMVAVATGNLEIVKLLVQLGADVSAESHHGDSALLTSVLNGFQNIFDYLELLTSSEIRVAVNRHIETGKTYPPKASELRQRSSGRNNRYNDSSDQSQRYAKKSSQG